MPSPAQSGRTSPKELADEDDEGNGRDRKRATSIEEESNDQPPRLGITVGAGAALALTPELLRAFQQSSASLIQRAIPSSGEMLPAVGLSFSNHVSYSDSVALREVLRTFAENGGRVFDAMHGNAASEQFHGMVANELGIQNRLFWSTRGSPAGPPQPGAAAAKAQIETTLARLNVPRIDLVMVNPTADPAHLGVLQEEKRAGRVRYIGAQAISDNLYPQLESVMRNEPIDFIGVDYDAGNRDRVEDTTAQGQVTGLILEQQGPQGAQRIRLERQ